MFVWPFVVFRVCDCWRHRGPRVLQKALEAWQDCTDGRHKLGQDPSGRPETRAFQHVWDLISEVEVSGSRLESSVFPGARDRPDPWLGTPGLEDLLGFQFEKSVQPNLPLDSLDLNPEPLQP